MSILTFCSILKGTWRHKLPTRSTAPQRRRQRRQKVEGRGKSPVSPYLFTFTSDQTRPLSVSSSTDTAQQSLIHVPALSTLFLPPPLFVFLCLLRCPSLSSSLSSFSPSLFPSPPSSPSLSPPHFAYQTLTAPPSLPPTVSSHAMNSPRNKGLSSKRTPLTRSSGKICWAPQEL